MKAKFLVQTRYKGSARKVGDFIVINDHVEAVRLVDAGIICFIEKDGSEETTHNKTYENMKAKDLYNLCVEKGLDVEPKQPKEVYIAALSGEEESTEE